MKKGIVFYILFLFVIYALPAVFALSSYGAPSSPDMPDFQAPPSKTVSVYFSDTDKVEELDIEEYLLGVVSAEMPAAFPLEALKAQAVASRSYILDKMASGGNKIPAHKGADVCTDSSHCKAWISKKERFKLWSEADRNKNWDKISTAVNETAGEYMTYNGQPITAVFYAISSGTTERAEDVWGSDVPYLTNADSSVDANAPGYRSTVVFSQKEFKKKMLNSYPDTVFSKNASGWYSNEKRSSGGAVLTCRIGDKYLKGTQVRSIFGLRSHNFTLEFKEGEFTFTVLGHGHGVGMSQWGAKFYADQGKNYRDILRIYYSGISFANSGI